MSRATKYNMTTLHPANSGYEGFRSKTEKMWFEAYFKSRKSVIAERPVEIFDFPEEVQQVIRSRRWGPQLQFKGECNETLVRLFYASIVSIEDDSFEAYVRGVRIPVTDVSLANLMGVPYEPRPAAYLSNPTLRPSKEEMATAFRGEPSIWYTEELKPSTFTRKYRLMDLIMHSSIAPTRHKNVPADRGAILYAICDPATRVDLASLIFSFMVQASQDIASSSALPYGVLITRICQAAGCREEPTDAHQPHISPLDERTLTRSEAQIRGVAKRARTGAE